MSIMNLSPHFTLQELLHSDTALRHGIDNESPPEECVNNMKLLCENVLEPLRAGIGRPIRITSGYRCLELNRLLKSPDSSQHTKGQAADIVVSGMSFLRLAKFVVETPGVDYDQVIYEGRWIHVSWSLRRRKEALTAGFAMKPPQPGYIKGIMGL